MSTESRVAIWKHNETVAEHMMQRAGNRENQAILICDTSDEIGGPLSEAIAAKAGCEDSMRDHREKIDAKGTSFQTSVAVIELPLLRALVRVTHPAVAEALRTTLPCGAFFALVIACGGVTLIAAKRPPQVQATSQPEN